MTDTSNPEVVPRLQIVVRELARCVHCGSTYTVKLRTSKGAIEYRKCQTCFKSFQIVVVTDRSEAPARGKQIPDSGKRGSPNH